MAVLRRINPPIAKKMFILKAVILAFKKHALQFELLGGTFCDKERLDAMQKLVDVVLPKCLALLLLFMTQEEITDFILKVLNTIIPSSGTIVNNYNENDEDDSDDDENTTYLLAH
ncbi:hypothetical protein TSAR_000235 [Trichomalopsis sarcophagae]|uniref:Uncharacterized protein n=1 Tax=Trichomalopsis sarcophagae TaxID=543379 RepID=A0A232EUH2_9HYME|nr:hypothetical protein TSAR_000235 [Trichomalopsis sarcophagae]